MSWRRTSAADKRVERSNPASEGDRDDEQHEADEQYQLSPDVRGLAGEEEREEDDRGDVRDGCGREHELAEPRPRLARVFEHRDDDPEGRRTEHDRDQERRFHEAGRVEREAGGERRRERHSEAQCADAEQPPAEAVHVHLEAGEQEEESQADE